MKWWKHETGAMRSDAIYHVWMWVSNEEDIIQIVFNDIAGASSIYKTLILPSGVKADKIIKDAIMVEVRQVAEAIRKDADEKSDSGVGLEKKPA